MGQLENYQVTNHTVNMGKGSARFGHKSGTLPEIRKILKAPTKPIVRPANPNTGYADGVPHPKGTSRVQPLPEVRTVSDLIKETVKAPKEIPNLQKLNEIQKEKVTKATLRREYYVEALKEEEQRLNTREKWENIRAEEEIKRKEQEVHDISESTRLTLPTIDSLLEGPFMRPRTEEEEEILRSKRAANRLNNELIGKTNRATNLLQLFYESENYITNESDLEKAIETAFSQHENNQMDLFNPESSMRSHDSLLKDALLGTIKSRPGLAAVEDQLSGESSKFDELVAQAVKEKHFREQEEARS